MLKNYFKIAWRSLKKNRLYAFVNIIGLAFGITSCILIGLYITHELSFDRFHVNKDRIVRVTEEYTAGGVVQKSYATGSKVGPELARNLPGIRDFTRTFQFPQVIGYAGKVFSEDKVLFADSNFFRIFSFPLLKGDPATVLNAPGRIVITQSMAKKYFGDDYPIGKSLTFSKTTQNIYTVTGVAADPPGNSQIPFQFVASFTSLQAAKNEQWWSANYITYFLLSTPKDFGPVQQAVTSFMRSERVRREVELKGSDYLTYHLEPLTFVHLHSSLDGYVPNGSITYVYILGAIALLILTIACVNYTNLSTAQAESRKGEISIRKVLGAGRSSLFGQYMGESILLTFIALILAVGISIELLPLFNRISGKDLTASLLFSPVPLLSLFVLGALVSLLAGSYPAFILSNLKLMNILKSGTRLSSSGGMARKSLIVFQFVISVFLMISTMIIFQQLTYIREKKLGYDKDHVLVLPLDNYIKQHYEDVKNAIALSPGVVSVSGSAQNPTHVEWTDDINGQGSPNTKDVTIKAIPTDLDFVRTMNMQIIAGAGFEKNDWFRLGSSGDPGNTRLTFLLNETAVKTLGWKPEEAVGKTVFKGGTPALIRGVVKDFHFSSLHEPIRPLMIMLDTQYVRFLFVKVNGRDIPRTIAHLQSFWKERDPFTPFEYHFLDEDYDALYKTETRTGQIFATFAISAILLACLGLFALAAYTTAQRTKEIGIRKVLGASLLSLAGLLSKDFLKLVAIAAIIAFPISWWAMHTWLEDFTYRISISWWVFAAAMLLSLFIALVTVSFQAIRAGLANPVDSLHAE